MGQLHVNRIRYNNPWDSCMLIGSGTIIIDFERPVIFARSLLYTAFVSPDRMSLYERILLLRFARVVAEAKCILVTRVYVSVSLSLAAFPQYCTDPDVSWGNGRGCPLIVRYLADLQSLQGFRCYDNIARNAKCQRVLILSLCLVTISISRHGILIAKMR